MRQSLAILRMVIGAGFVFLGITNLLNERLLYGGLMERLQSIGAPFGFYRRWVLIRYVETNEEGFVIFVSVLAIVVGLLLLTGLFVSLASVIGAAFIANVALATTAGRWSAFGLHIGLAISLLFIGWVGGGLTWGLDALLIQRLPGWLVLAPLRIKAPE